jgi:ATP-binding cassette subfamily B protein
MTPAAPAEPDRPAAALADGDDALNADELIAGDASDDDDDDELAVYTAREAAGALATVHGFAWPYLRRYKRALTFVGVGLVIETLFNVIMPLSLKYLIDDALGEEDFHALTVILSVLAVAGIVTSIVAVWYERWDARLSAAALSDARAHLFEHVQNLPSGYFARTRRGEILSRFSVDLAAFETSLKTLASGALLPLFELVAGVLLLVFLSWELAAVALLIFPITLIGPRILTPKAVQANYDQKVNESALLGMVQENVAAQAVIKAFSLQRRMLGWFTLRNDATQQRIAAATFLSSMVERSVTVSVLLLHLVVLAFGAYLATKGHISIGTFVTFESAFWEISYNVAHLMHYIPLAIQSAAAVRHMQELLDEPPRGADRACATELPPIAHAIAFEHVDFGYDEGAAPVLAGLNLSLGVGRSIAIVGPSGSGKSTLINLILRLYTPDAGRVSIDGLDIRKVTRESLRARMAVVFQDNMLFNMSIRENIRLGKEGATDAEVEAAARKAEIDRFIRRLPHGYDTQVGERGDTLSGGQRQRIAIARALVRDPAVLLLDEATSALDQTTEAAINRTLRKAAHGRTMIFATHRLTAVTDMDEIVVLSEGRVAERGTHAQLLAAGGVYCRLWNDHLNNFGAGADQEMSDDMVADGLLHGLAPEA